MKLGNPIKIADDVYQLRTLGARVTVLVNGGEAVLVDAGGRGSLGPIASGLEALDLSLEQVRLVVLTHYHPDHSGGLGKLVEATSAKVAVHNAEAGIVSGEESAPSPYSNKVVARLSGLFIAPLYGTPVEVDYPLEDEDFLPVVDAVKVIHTPGHTAGTICLHAGPQKLLIVGDALQFRLWRLSPPAQAVTRDSAQAKESLKKLVDLDFDTICFGHFPPLRGEAHETLREMLQETKSDT